MDAFALSNLASHVSKVLAPTRLEDATEEVLSSALVDFKRRHDLVRTRKGKEVVPFGKKEMTLKDIRARLEKDQKRKMKNKVKKRK